MDLVYSICFKNGELVIGSIRSDLKKNKLWVERSNPISLNINNEADVYEVENQKVAILDNERFGVSFSILILSHCAEKGRKTIESIFNEIGYKLHRAN
mgnify:CR=1 FL=1